MNIWLINPYGPLPDEAWREYYFTTLGRTLGALGHSVTWWTSNYSHHFKRYRAPGWTVVPVCQGFRIVLVPATQYSSNVGIGRYASETIFAANVLRRAGLEDPPQLIIGGDSPQPASCVSLFLAKRFGARLFLSAMDQWPELFVLAFPKMLKGLAPVLLWPLYAIRRSIRRRADAIFSLAEKYLHDALSEIPSWKQVETMTIYNGIDVANFRKLLVQNLKGNSCNGSNKKPPGEVWAVFAGTLGNNYDICTIVQAGVLLRERCKVVKLVVAGAGPCLGTIQRGIAEYSLSNLIYCGVYSHEALIGLYSQCDMALCTYGKESNVGMPDKVYDYMAAGLPIINSLSGELKELIESLDIGQQYTPGDPASLAMAITRLAEDEELRRCEAANSFEAAMHFDRDVQFSKICELLARFPVPE